MSAELVDDVFDSEAPSEDFSEPVVQEAPKVAVEAKPELPDKLKNKTAEEIAEMYMESEKLRGRQSQEVGEIRRLADQLIREKLAAPKPSQSTTPESAERELTDVDFFADPVKAVQRAVDSHPAVQQARQTSARVQQKESLDRLTSAHPDYKAVLADDGFREWVGKSRIRQTLYAQADRNYDVEAAHELLSNYKELRVRRAEVATEGATAMRQESEKALKAVSIPSGGSGETSKKVYRRADLIRLQMTDPDRYMQLNDEIMAAYAEGRVK